MRHARPGSPRALVVVVLRARALRPCQPPWGWRRAVAEIGVVALSDGRPAQLAAATLIPTLSAIPSLISEGRL